MARIQPTQKIFGAAGNAGGSGLVSNSGEIINGTNSNDTLFGSPKDDTLIGGDGNDQLLGGAGNDYLDGFGGGSKEIDSLTGGAGLDIFVIGNSKGVYYQSGVSDDEVDFSFAKITDFLGGEDFIQASGSSSNYELVFGEWFGNANQDTGIYLGDDLIAVVQDTTDVIFVLDFIFV